MHVSFVPPASGVTSVCVSLFFFCSQDAGVQASAKTRLEIRTHRRSDRTEARALSAAMFSNLKKDPQACQRDDFGDFCLFEEQWGDKRPN